MMYFQTLDRTARLYPYALLDAMLHYVQMRFLRSGDGVVNILRWISALSNWRLFNVFLLVAVRHDGICLEVAGNFLRCIRAYLPT